MLTAHKSKERLLYFLLTLFVLRLSNQPGHCLASVSALPVTAQEVTSTEGLTSVVGQSLFAVGSSRLYQTDATIEEMQPSAATYKQYLTGWEAMEEFCLSRFCQSRRIPLLVPLRIIWAKYMAASHAVILAMKLPNGTEVLTSTTTAALENRQGDVALLEKVCGSLLTRVPDSLSFREIDAIRKREPFRGMQKAAVYDMFGIPTTEERVNSGTRLIYSDTLVVFLDQRDQVEGIQSPGLASRYASAPEIVWH